ncbi:heterokaryon incompatibility protein-domain-containing protein [Cercophora newfieldiana]|uniref:Heterokaryon incompatibility protein-domain-containing protein n=1 Tax=Cercophora newfieldiana TaxID=92897 RepID=A0AA39XUW9_9PEZI|nr:heterokaryon incompatibility protein-domain-containing protein [Cercophora newfieldiana]
MPPSPMDIDLPSPPGQPPDFYQPLPPHTQSIRLLRLHPSRLPSSPLVVTLHTYPLNSSPPYESISYVWGAPSIAPVVISCNDTPFPITPNLHWALCRVRLRDQFRFVWADAICVNQGDVAERAAQVAFMGKIYATARRVLVCMGEAPTVGGERAVLELLWRFQGGPRGIADILGDGTGWAAVAELMGRPWFRRTWVMQEVGMAREAVVLYGMEEFGYRELMGLVGWSGTRTELIKYGIVTWRIHREWLDWERWEGREEKTFFDLLDHASLLSCHDPRDRVYAFLGHPLAQRADGKGPILMPDYTKDVNELYWEVARVCLDMVGLKALTTVEHTEESLDDGYPSWVTRWNITHMANSISQFPRTTFRTGGPADPSYRPSSQGPVLLLPGATADTLWVCFRIGWLGGNDRRVYFTEVGNPGHPLGLGDLLVLLTNDQVFSVYGSGVEERLGAFGLTLCASPPDYRATKEHLYGLKRLLALEKAMPGVDPMHPEVVDAMAFWAKLTASATGRTFAVTERGLYGLVPQLARPGDKVCAIRGLDVPLVMRVVAARHALLGEAYVHGIMEGEAMSAVMNGALQEDVFAVS